MKRAVFLWALIGASVASSGCRSPGQSGAAGASEDTLLGRPLALRGVSLAGAEFGVDPFGKGALPGAPGVNYFYPDPLFSHGYASADYFIGKGMNTFRLPFRWERLQPAREQAFDPAELNRLKTTVSHLVAKGAYVVIDPHNYARYGAGVIGAEIPLADFTDFWSRLAIEFKGDLHVVFALMNEPHDMPTEQWVDAANAAIVAIRATGAMNLILVPGNGYSGAHSWYASFSGPANADALLKIVDSKANVAFEAHQHLDDDSSGTSARCTSENVGAERLAPFTRWLKAHHKKGFLGEFSGGSDAMCLRALASVLTHLEENKSVYVGWTYWAAGPAWKSYFTSIEPQSGVDRPQMSVLAAHLAK